MVAGRAYIGRCGTDNDMAAVTALPNLNFAFGKNFGHFHSLIDMCVYFTLPFAASFVY